MLRSLDCYLVSHVLVRPIGPIFEDQVVFLECLSPESGLDNLYHNVGK